MLQIVLNWIYIFIISLILGIGTSIWIEKKTNYQLRSISAFLMIGLAQATVYAQTVSIFYKVGLLANILLVMICLGLLCIYHKEYKQLILHVFREGSRVKFFVSLVLFFIFAFFTSRGYMHYDSDLYHAQAIRWIEEYGVVKGLGNLHNRFAYNSSFFALSALYSMSFLGAKLHAVNGFISWILCICCLPLFFRKEHKLLLSDFARLAALYYLSLIVDEIVSPASDFAIMCTIFYLVITLLDLFEKDHGRISCEVPYALISLGCVFAVSLKLTTGLLLIITLIPLFVLLKNRNWKRIGCYVLCGFLLVLPWLVRNVIISGYLIYPMTALDLFPVDWKMPADIVNFDSDEIKVFGRALYDVSKINLPPWEWLPNWFRTTLSVTEKLIILMDFVAFAVLAVRFVMDLVQRNSKRTSLNVLYFAIILSFGFWFLSAPLIRYGYVYALLLPALCFGEILVSLPLKNTVQKALYYCAVGFCILKIVLLCPYLFTVITWDSYVVQQDYGHYEVQEIELDGITFYVPVDGDRTGYDVFPATPTVHDSLKLRGTSIKDGFMNP